MVEVVLVHAVDNQFSRQSIPKNLDILYIFISNESHAYLSNFGKRNLLFLKTCNTEFYDIIVTFTNQNDEPLEVEGKINWT